MKKILLVILFCTSAHSLTFGQNQIKMQGYIREIYNPLNWTDHVFNVYMKLPNASTEWKPVTDRLGGNGCLQTNFKPLQWNNLSTDLNIPDTESSFIFNIYDGYNNWSSLPEFIKIQLDGWSNRGGNGSVTCKFDGKDDDHGFKYYNVHTDSIPPGNWTDIKNVVNAQEDDEPAVGTPYNLRFSIRYVVQPDPVAAANNEKRVCTGKNVRLTAPITILPPTVRLDKSSLEYIWEYYVQGDTKTNPDFTACSSDCAAQFGYGSPKFYECESACRTKYPPIPNWQAVATTNLPNLDFDPLTQFFGGNLTAVKSVYFRVKTRAGTGVPYDRYLESDYSPVSVIDFLPPPPVLSNNSTTPTCPNQPTGTLTATVSGITGNSFLYILEKGNSTTRPACKPDEIANNSCTGNVYLANRVTTTKPSDTFTLSNLPVSTDASGLYTLWILNEEANGTCDNRYLVEIKSYPLLTASLGNKTNITCFGGSNGTLQAAYTGGKPGGVTFTLQALSPLTDPDQTNATGLFTNLNAGSYKILVSDACSQLVTLPVVTLSQPPQVVLDPQSATPLQAGAATCSQPGNGQLRLKIARTPGTSVSPSFYYRLTQAENPAFLIEKTVAESNWDVNDLPPGTFQVFVKESGSPDCNALIQTFTISPPPALQLSKLSQTDVLCNGSASGSVALAASGNPTGYYFRLTDKNNTSRFFTNTNGNFTDLPAGDYLPTVFRRLPADTCYETAAAATVTIRQPGLLAVGLSKQDITCFAANDGSYTGSISGGVAPYEYSENQGAVWKPVSGNTFSKGGLTDDIYTVLVRDANACQVTSPAITIFRPAQLAVSQVTAADIRCLGEKSNIAVKATGGTAPYTYSYSNDNGKTYSAFLNNSPFEAGTYLIQVQDSRGCQANADKPVVITAPPTALDFSYTLSDYNGFAVSCRGGQNGKLFVQPTGGNGAAYTGYKIAMDGRTFQATDSLTGIAAGTHIFTLSDARGCQTSKTITFSEPALSLSLQLVTKTEVVCAGDKTGSLDVAAVGGVAPFRYSLDTNRTWQPGSRFDGLPAGAYHVAVSDKNGCQASLFVKINSLYPPILITATTDSVKCRGESNGRISVQVSGGVAPFAFAWEGQTATNEQLNALPAGTYKVTATDSKGCSATARFSIGEPKAVLTLNFVTKPVCYGKTNGEIRLTAAGGTPPYQYSADNGGSFSKEALFDNLTSHSYQVVVQDSRGCRATTLATVEQRLVKPEPDFLISSAPNALDTLVIKEISVPELDSVAWVFDSQALVIDKNPASPRIKFAEAGSYTVSMTGYLGGCAETLTKTLKISPYDPNVKKLSLGVRPIESLIVAPNPSDGTFEVRIKLLKKQPVHLQLFDTMGNLKFNLNAEGVLEFTKSLSMTDLPSGLYLLRVTTSNDASDVKITINK